MRRRRFLCCMTLLCALLLGACGTADTEPGPAAGTEPGTQQTDGSAPTPSGEDGAVESVTAAAVPYTLSLDAAVQIFDGPGYDCAFVQAVGQDGVYTIEGEARDGEGNLWGRLRSGVGWVNLSDLRSGAAQQAPVMVFLGDEALLRGGRYETYTAEESPYAVKLVFRAREPLSRLRLLSLEPRGDSYETAETLYTLETLEPETPLVAEVVYYGDMTVYGVSFTDSAGSERCYAVYLSGRNGSLILEEYRPRSAS